MEHDSTNEIISNENQSDMKHNVERDTNKLDIEITNLTSLRVNHVEESKETCSKITSDMNNQNFLLNLQSKQESLIDELESLRETVIKMQEEIKNLTNNYNQLKSESLKTNRNDASAIKKNDLLKNYATTPNKTEKGLKMKKSEVAAPKTPLTKTTINLKMENQDVEKFNDRMYKTVKSNNKDLKKTQTDKSVVRKNEKKGEDQNLKKSKLAEHSATFSTDAKDNHKEKISLHTKIKKPLNGGATKTLKDKSAADNESKKYLTEKKTYSNARMSVNDKLKEGEDDKSKKGNHRELVKAAANNKKNTKKENPKKEIENKKKEEKVDSQTVEPKNSTEQTTNPFVESSKNVVADLTEPLGTAREPEPQTETNEEKHSEDVVASEEKKGDLVEVESKENLVSEVKINLDENPVVVTEDLNNPEPEKTEIHEVEN